jgi:hypothetical protein
VLDASVSNTDGFLFLRDTCQLRYLGIFEANKTTSTSKHSSCRKNSFKKVPQFTHGNNVLDTSACKTNDLFQEIHVFLHLR